MKSGGPLLDDPSIFHHLIARLVAEGFAVDDILWSEKADAPKHPEQFALETIFVICNSGMQNKIARQIFERCRLAIFENKSVKEVFGHPGKAAAIDEIWANRQTYFNGYIQASDKIEFCKSIPWIGGITCYHLAKNFGAPVAKPDVHLQRLADRHSLPPQNLCEEIASKTGFKIGTVDLILWRGCAERILDSRTGRLFVSDPVVEPQKEYIQQTLFQPEQQEMFL